ncbi:MAG: PadR family transcriptional regulator [Acidimicrobiales bacterium]|nr:PadR family transcriptional regulator [Acidimicrobiales bacterium]
MARTTSDVLLLGEWACLGILAQAPAHGFAVAKRLAPDGDIGRVWSLSRALTYRALDQLVEGGHIHVVGEEPGTAGGVRTVLAPTRTGRALLKRWVVTPAVHLRDVRSELLLKLVLADGLGIDTRPLLVAQRERVVSIAAARAQDDPHDVVVLWRRESAEAVVRFLDALLAR